MLSYCAKSFESTFFQVVFLQRFALKRQRTTIERMFHVEFLIEKKGDGYQRAQVDAYIRELRQTYQQMYEAYQVAHREYAALEMRYGELQTKYQVLENRAQTQMAQMNPQAGMPYPGYQPWPVPASPCGVTAPYEATLPYGATAPYGATQPYDASAPYGAATPAGYYY